MTEVGAGDFVTAETLNYIIQRAVNRPVCRLVLTANFSTSNATATATPFAAGSEIMDDLNWHSTSSNTSRITPTYPGRYLVTGNVTWAQNTTGDRRVYLQKVGVASAAFQRPQPITGNPTTVFVSDILEANGTTDYFELTTYQSSGGALNVAGLSDNTNSTMFSVAYLGDLL